MAIDNSRLQEIKSKVSVPMYFYNVIIPQRSEYYSDFVVDFDAKPVVKCPIHDEDTPSMRFYEETNTFYCFGCRAGGDIIELHRKFVERMSGTIPSMEETIDFLYNFFIKGKSTAKLSTATSLNKQSELSSHVEIMRYTKYINNLEDALIVDGSIDEENKEKIWYAIDSMDVLVSKNIVNAIEAMGYIKDAVYRIWMETPQ